MGNSVAGRSGAVRRGPARGGGNRPTTGFLQEVAALLEEDARGIHVVHEGLRLASGFQPVYSLAHRKPVGYEGLLRAFGPAGEAVSPMTIFDQPRSDAELVYLDRICRALHVGNACRQGIDPAWLFLNVHPSVVINGRDHGAFFAELLEYYGTPPSRVVIEILEGAIGDEVQLAESVNFFKDLGCLVAIDDFGAGHSNFERIWRLQPDLVKLDRAMVQQAARQEEVRRILPGLVSLIHESGCLVVMEGIETEQEAMMAIDCDADFVQGFYFGRPTLDIADLDHSPAVFDTLLGKFRTVMRRETGRYQRRMNGHLQALERAAADIATGVPVKTACRRLLSRDGITRCYLLDAEGVQMGGNLESGAATTPDHRFEPVANAEGASWYRRPYFRRAVCMPGTPHVSRPYLSVRDASTCITLSIAFETDAGLRVLCTDLRPQGNTLWSNGCG